MRFGGWYPDYVLRLAKRELCKFDPAPVHEKLIVEGAIGQLRQPLLHFSYRNIDDLLEKQKRYITAGAQQLQLNRRRARGFMYASARATWTFVRLYFLQVGFFDGYQGLLSAIFKSQVVFWKYIAVRFETEQRQWE